MSGGQVPRVSIVVPARDCRELTEACLASIARHTHLPHEVLLVDDASGAEAAAAFRRLAADPVRLIRSEAPGTFSASNNRAADVARGAFLCLLNNDTLVTPGWLEALVAVAEREADVGVIGNKQLFPDQPGLHHAGMAFDAAGAPLHLHPHTDTGAPAVNCQRDVPCVTFACVLIPTAVYRRLGGLDEAYRNGFEDCDFCLRARRAGLRVIYTPASVIRHYGQRTPGRTLHDDDNWRLFQARWPGRERGSLERITREDREYNRRVARRPRLRPAAPEGLHLAVDLSAGNAFSWATASLVEALVARADRVAVSLPASAPITATIGREQRRLLRSLMRPRPCGTWHVKWSHYWPAHLRRELSGAVNAEIFCTNYRGGVGRHATDPWLRNVQVNGYRKLAVSRFNLEALDDVGVPERDCAVVPLGYAPEIERLFPDAPRREGRREKRLLLVTNSHDLLRYGTDLAVRALGEAFGPGDPVVVHVQDYGASAGSGRLREWVGAQARFPRVVWHTKFLAKEELLHLYAGMDALLAPFRGEGFSMKILDAMALGLPVIMPGFGGPMEFAAPGTFVELPWRPVPVGACLDRESWYLSDEAWWCEPDAPAIAETLRAWAADDAPARRAGEAAAAHVRGRYTWANAAERLVDALRGWQSAELVVTAARRQPDRVPLSVVIPTKDRAATLAKTLDAYTRQSLATAQFEMLLVNDGGDRAPLDAAVAPFAGRLPLRLVDNPGPAGPAAARNAGIERAGGAVVLITGDDIVPDPGLLAAHLAGHRRFRRLEQGVIGLTRWHPDLPVTPLMRHVTGEGGQQFNFRGLRDGGRATPDRFYTSNCSLKRAFLAEEPGPFSTVFRLAAYEDVELAHRLGLRGLELRFLAGAVGYHDHAISPESFLERQVGAGRMLALLAVQRPAYVPGGHAAFIPAMEYALRHLRGLRPPVPTPGADASDPPRTDILDQPSQRGWEAASERALRTGMALEWARTDEDREFLRQWVTAVSLPLFLDAAGHAWRLPRAAAGGDEALFPDSAAALLLSRFLRTSPVLGGLVTRIEASPAGRLARRAALRLLGRR